MLSTAVHFPGTPWSKNLALGQDGDGDLCDLSSLHMSCSVLFRCSLQLCPQRFI